MSRSPVPVYLCNPETLDIIHRCTSELSAARLCKVTRQAINDALKTGYLVKGFLVVTPKTYPDLK